MLKAYILYLAVFFISAVDYAQMVINYPSGNKHYEYNFKNGLADGAFTCYYENGQKELRGSFSSNQRIGEWSAWDESGTKNTKRFYRGSFTYIYKDASGTHTNSYYNSGDETNTTPPTSNIIYSKTLWRVIPNNEQNKALFTNNGFVSGILKAAHAGAIKMYSDDALKNVTSESVEDAVSPMAILLKEIYVYDSGRNIGQYYPLGISFLKSYTIENSKDATYWMPYADIKAIAERITVEGDDYPGSIKNVDQLIFQRFFNSYIYKVSDNSSIYLNQYPFSEQQQQEAIEAEFSILEKEASLW